MAVFTPPTIVDLDPFDPTVVETGLLDFGVAINALDQNNIKSTGDKGPYSAHKGHFVDPHFNQALAPHNYFLFFNPTTPTDPWGSNTNIFVVASQRFYLKETAEVLLSAWHQVTRWKTSWVTPGNTVQMFADFYLQLDGVTVRQGRFVSTFTDLDDQPGGELGLKALARNVGAGTHDVSLLVNWGQSSTSLGTADLVAQYKGIGSAAVANVFYR